MIFWNVAGLTNKDGDFWKYLRDFNVISLTETLLKERGEEKLRDKLPRDYKQSCQAAVRDKFKGRGMGGMIVGIRREIREKKIEQKREDMIDIRFRIGEEKWRIISVYKKKTETCVCQKSVCLEEITDKEERKLIIGGDFNARIGTQGEIVWNG